MNSSAPGRGGLGGIFAAHSRWLRRRLAARSGADVGEEVVQETFLRLAASTSEAEVHSPRALLLKVAGNVMADQARRGAVRGGGATVAFDAVWEGFEPGAAGDQHEALLLKQVVLGLPELYRDVFVLSRFDGLTYVEIARHLGLSVKTVEWRMSQALAHCAAQLGR